LIFYFNASKTNKIIQCSKTQVRKQRRTAKKGRNPPVENNSWQPAILTTAIIWNGTYLLSYFADFIVILIFGILLYFRFDIDEDPYFDMDLGLHGTPGSSKSTGTKQININ
jgi:hypothetical protein